MKWAFFLGGTCEGWIGVATCFGDGASRRGLGLGEGAGGGGGGGEEEVAGALEALVEDACNFASRFMRIWSSVSQGCRHGHERDAKAYTVGIIGRISQWLARTHDRNSFSSQIRSDEGVRCILGSLPDGRLADEQGGQLGMGMGIFQSTLYNQPVHDAPLRSCSAGWRVWRTATRRNMFSLASFSTARQFIVASPRLFSSSATLGYPKLKTHSGTKKRWRAIASGAFKRVSSVHFVLPARY